MLVLKDSNAFSANLIDLLAISIIRNTNGIEMGDGRPNPSLSHVSVSLSGNTPCRPRSGCRLPTSPTSNAVMHGAGSLATNTARQGAGALAPAFLHSRFGDAVDRATSAAASCPRA